MNRFTVYMTFVLLMINCATPSALVSLRSASETKVDNPKARTAKSFPLNAKPGQCFSKVIIPAEYKSYEEQVLISKRSSRIERDEAVYETVNEEVLDKPGSTFWKTSPEDDIYYLDSIPATYKKISKKVLKTPAVVRVIDIPAEYKTETKQKLVKPEDVDWPEIICGNNARTAVIKDIQQSLKLKNFPPGREDGQLDEATIIALNNYQRANGLKVDKNGLINMDTVKSLGATSSLVTPK